MAFIAGQPVTAVVQRIEIRKLRHGDNLILGFSIGGGIDQDPAQNPYSEDKTDKILGCSSQERHWRELVQVLRNSNLVACSSRVCKEGIYVTRVSEEGPAEVAGLQIGDKIMQVNGWDMTMVTHDQARKRLTKKNEDVVRLLVTRKSLQQAIRQSLH
ncbi:tax1-binding protein 3 isoform X1 [Scyliorhinus canicula]|uniref:tax1-binding protein 3 isoform X1 n=1 Tax=Scyliorhinus canicula TaxID=7830 RepID=UPI0018F3ED95|nr:tax1-binding protein 3 isoform X1 [Scyliorhinus canicula]